MTAPVALTRQQHLIFCRLREAAGKTVSVEQLALAAYGDRPDGGTEWAHDSVRIHIMKIRQRLGREAILSHWGRGYRLPANAALPEIVEMDRRGMAAHG